MFRSIVSCVVVLTALTPLARGDAGINFDIHRVGIGSALHFAVYAQAWRSDGTHSLRIGNGDIERWSVDSYTFPTMATVDELKAALSTNPWQVIFDEGLPTEQIYHFTIDASGLSEEVLPTTTIISPTRGQADVAQIPTFLFTGPYSLGGVVHVAAHNLPSGPSNPVQLEMIPGTSTSWSPPNPLSPGDAHFKASHALSDPGWVVLSTPTLDENSAGVAEVNWENSIGYISSANISFTVIPEPATAAIAMGAAMFAIAHARPRRP